VLGLSTAATAAFGLFLGPFVIVPAMVAQNTIYFAAVARSGAQRAAAIAVGTLGVLVPWALEIAGVIPRSFDFEGGAMRFLPRMAEFPPLATQGLLLVASLILVIVPSLVLARLNDDRIRTKLRLLTHLWHFRQLVPAEAQPTATMTSRAIATARRRLTPP